MHKHQKIARNIVALAIAQLFTWASSAGLLLLLPRFLQPHDYGAFAVASAYMGFLMPLTDLGMTTSLTRETPRLSQHEVGALLADALILRIPLILLSTALGVAGSFLIIRDEQTRLLFLILLPSLALQAFQICISATLRGLEEMGVTAWADGVGKGASLCMIAFLLLTGKGVLWVAGAASVYPLVILVMVTIALARRIGIPGPLNPGLWQTRMTAGLPFFVTSTAIAFHSRADLVIIQALTGVAVAGWYSLAYGVVSFQIFLPSMLVGAFFPAISRAGTNPPELQELAQRCLRLVLLGSLPMSFGLLVLSSSVVRLLGYTDEYARSVPLIAILSLSMPLIAVNMVVGTAAFAFNRETRFMKVMIAATVVDILLNLSLVGLAQQAFDNGAIASAGVAVFTEVLILILGLRLLPAGVFDRSDVEAAARALLAIALMVLAVLPVRGAFIAAPATIGALTYLAGAVLFGAIKPHDIKLLTSIVRRRKVEGLDVASASLRSVEGSS